MIALQPKQRQILAVLLLVALLLLVFGLVVQPLLGYYIDKGDTLDSLEQRREIYQRLVDELPRQLARLEELRQQDPSGQLAFQEPRPALAAANLQQLVGQAISSAGGEVVSTQILTREKSGAPIPEIGLRVRMRSDTGALVRVLHTLAYHQPLLLVDELEVNSNSRLRAIRPGAGPAATTPVALGISFTVTSLTAPQSPEVANE